MKSNFLIVGLTTPDQWENPEYEADAILNYMSAGTVDLFHIRKPLAEKNYVRQLIRKLPETIHARLTLHSHYNLISEFRLGGIHIKAGWNPLDIHVYDSWRISRSCHSFSEFEGTQASKFTYSFLSPIYDSISKAGYHSNFEGKEDDLLNLNQKHSIVALGGVTPESFQKLFDLKFAGAALLGYLWSLKVNIAEKIAAIIKNRNIIKNT